MMEAVTDGLTPLGGVRQRADADHGGIVYQAARDVVVYAGG
jgi:hypothetical protein